MIPAQTVFPSEFLLALIVFAMSAISLASLLFARYSEIKNQILKEEFAKKHTLFLRKLYELSVLQEIEKRIGYSLNIQKICEIITSSIGDLVKFSSVSYAILDEDKIIFRTRLEEAVDNSYVPEVKHKILTSMSALFNKDMTKIKIDAGIAGAVIGDFSDKKLRSFFNVPLFAKGNVVGVINVSSTVKDLYSEESNAFSLYKLSEQASVALTKLQEVLDSEKSKLEIMVESLANGVFYVDSEMRLLVINKSAKDMLKIESLGLINILDIANIFPKTFDFNRKLSESLKMEKDIVEPELFLNDRFFKIIFTPVKGDSRILGVAVLMQDISDQKLLEKMRKDFTSMMVHDLRAPLNVMYGTSDLLTKRSNELEKIKLDELLFEIKNSSHNMLGIVNDLLDDAKIEAGKFVPQKVEGDIVELIKAQVAFFKPLAERKNLYLKTEFSQEFLKVSFDKDQISRVLANLISNGIKFTKEGGINIKVIVEEKEVKISVIDTGCGINEEQRGRLFNKFEQVRSPVDPLQKGTGLGLVIAKGIAEAHGGKMWVESDGKSGASFNFTLPL
ncbi:MAG: ATP-binding protein [bacterium]